MAFKIHILILKPNIQSIQITYKTNNKIGMVIIVVMLMLTFLKKNKLTFI